MKNKISYFLIIFISVLVLISCNSRQKFVSQKWRQGNSREIMVHDLIKSDILIGMNQEQVIDLLGTGFKIKTTLQYLIKMEYGGPSLSPKITKYLLIEFDEKGEVERCKIYKIRRKRIKRISIMQKKQKLK